MIIDQIIDQIIEAITYDLRCGNCFTLPQLSFFQPSIPGAFDPADFNGITKHPLRMTLRVRSVFNDNLNRGAALKHVDTLPACLKIKNAAYSMALEAACKHYGGTPVCVGAVRTAAHQIVLSGSFRTLPTQGVTKIQRLSAAGITFDAPISIPTAPLTPPTHKSQRKTMLSVDISAISTRLLPGPPGVCAFTAAPRIRRSSTSRSKNK